MLVLQTAATIAPVAAAASVDIVAIAGIAGTLLGTVIGAVVTWKVLARQLEHDDRTRFHHRRLEVYAEFNDASDKVGAAMMSGNPTGEHLANAVRTFELLRLVASEGVFVAATLVHGNTLALLRTPVANRAAQLAACNTSMTALVAAMRAEIGVEP